MSDPTRVVAGTEQPLGDGRLQITTSNHEMEEGEEPTALFTCRHKDQDLTASQLLAIANACIRTIRRLQGEEP